MKTEVAGIRGASGYRGGHRGGLHRRWGSVWTAMGVVGEQAAMEVVGEWMAIGLVGVRMTMGVSGMQMEMGVVGVQASSEGDEDGRGTGNDSVSGDVGDNGGCHRCR